MKSFFLILIGAISLVLGSTTVTHQLADRTTVEAGENC